MVRNIVELIIAKNNMAKITEISSHFLNNCFVRQTITINSNTYISKDIPGLSKLETCPVQTQGFIDEPTFSFHITAINPN